MCKDNRSFKLYCTVVSTIGLILIFVICGLALGSDYNRDNFKHWSDLDGDGLDSRQEALLIQSLSIKDIHYVTLDDKASRVLIGLWVCPYTGEVVTDISKLDIDHIVSLKYAWEHGADKWNSIQREMFANDPNNLLVTRDYINSAKSDSGPEEWLPPNASYIKTYIEKFMYVCNEYKLECDIPLLLSIKEEYKNVRSQSR